MLEMEDFRVVVWLLLKWFIAIAEYDVEQCSGV